MNNLNDLKNKKKILNCNRSTKQAAIIVPLRRAEPTPNVVWRTTGLSALVRMDSWAILSRDVVVNVKPTLNATLTEPA